MGEYNPKSKGVPASWRGIQRRLPKTLSTFQIVVLTGFLSLLILRSTIGIASFNFTSHYPREIRLGSRDVESKRNLVHSGNSEQEDDHIRDMVRGESDLEVLEEEFDSQILHITIEDARRTAKIATARKDVKVENFQEVEAQLGEEETADELADFEKFEKGEKEATTSILKSKAGSDVQSSTVVKDSEIKKTPEEQLQDEELRRQAVANMTNAIHRDDPDAFTLGPRIGDWDEQRVEWLLKNPEMKTSDPHKPKVLLLSGSQPLPCKSPVGDHYLLKMIKNKMDYARIHKMEVYYNLAHLDERMSDLWAKLPLIRKMMLIHPEVEWIFWMDSDAVFTDMVFEVPFEKYEAYNLVMWGYADGIFDKRSWVACNTGVLFLRNNQWTLDLLEALSHMGPAGKIRTEVGQIFTSYLTSRPKMVSDDQSALVYLMLTEPELLPKIFLEDDYWLSGYWEALVSQYETFLETSRPGAGGRNWPFTTHFTGCQSCSGEDNELHKTISCLDGLEKAFNFADNQVLKPFGFEHESLLGSKVKRIRNETTQPIWSVPIDNPWAVDSFY